MIVAVVVIVVTMINQAALVVTTTAKMIREKRRKKKKNHGLVREVRQLLREIKHDEKKQKVKFGSGKKGRNPLKVEQLQQMVNQINLHKKTKTPKKN